MLSSKCYAMEHRIDAANQILGRLATRVAVLLRGKDRPDFDPARFSDNKVAVHNTDKMRVTGKKMPQKKYRRHSGYPGGLKEEALERLFARDSREVLRRAVLGMLPKNRLRSRWIKNLILRK
ncbi:MAG: 50S ribosomal protein L13 [Candidatus Sungbacteria bacterium]|nr:50S ribosomal protein L13 [Candidatus Sungbacteria bacterium]